MNSLIQNFIQVSKMNEETYNEKAFRIFIRTALDESDKGQNSSIHLLFEGLRTKAGFMFFEEHSHFLETAINKGKSLLDEIGVAKDKQRKSIRKSIVSLFLALQTKFNVAIPNFTMYLEDFDDLKDDEEVDDEDCIYIEREEYLL